MSETIDHLLKPDVLLNYPDKHKLFFKLVAQINWDNWPEDSKDVKIMKVAIRLGTLILDELDAEGALDVKTQLEINEHMFQQVLDMKRENDESIRLLTEAFTNRRTGIDYSKPAPQQTPEHKQQLVDALVQQIEAAMVVARANQQQQPTS